MKKIFLIEDEWVHAEDLRVSLEELDYELLGYSSEGMDAIESIRTLQPDIILIDLNLHGRLSGLLIAGEVKKLFSLPFIFITSHLDDDIIRKCMNLDPVAYLHKPVNKGDLKAALIKAEQMTAAENDNVEITSNGTELNLMIRVGKQLKPLSPADILAVHTDAKNYVKIVTTQNNQYAVRCSLSTMEKWLPPTQFIRVHKEYIVQLQHITSVNEAEQLIQVDKLTIPIGRNFRADFFARYTIL